MLNSSFTQWGFTIGQLFGIRIRIHWAFLIFVLMELLQSANKTYTALFLLILFTTVLLHEFGHCFGARRFGLKSDEVLLWPFGGLAFTGHGRNSWEDFCVSFAGPAVHIPLGLLSAAWLHMHGATFALEPSILSPVAATLPDTSWPSVICYLIFRVQVMSFVLNVFLPAYPMDGGRMLAAILRTRFDTPRTSGIVMITTVVSSVFLMSQGNQFLGLFLICEAAILYQMRQTGEIYQHPSFASTQPMYVSSPRKGAAKAKPGKSKQVPHLRLVDSKQCPQCGRSLPTSAKMCGFCEISV